MPDINCKTCGGIGWVTSRAAGCPECAPPLPPKPKRKPRKRTPIRKKSSKQKAVEKEMAPLRKRWRQHVRTCMVCDTRMATEVHEIVAGAGRHLSYENPLTWIACCNPCHAEIQGKPYETQANIVAAAVRRAINRCAIRDAI